MSKNFMEEKLRASYTHIHLTWGPRELDLLQRNRPKILHVEVVCTSSAHKPTTCDEGLHTLPSEMTTSAADLSASILMGLLVLAVLSQLKDCAANYQHTKEYVLSA